MLLKKMFTVLLAILISVTMIPVALAEEVRSVSIRSGNFDGTMLVGQSRSLEARILPGDADDQRIWWDSSNSRVVEVSGDGYIYAVSSGTATIRASANNGRSTSITIEVFNSIRERTDAEEAQRWNNRPIGGTNPPVPPVNPPAAPTPVVGPTATAPAGPAMRPGELLVAVSESLVATAPGVATFTTVRGGRTSVPSTDIRDAFGIAEVARKPLTIMFTTPDAAGATQGQMNFRFGGTVAGTYINPAVYTTGASVERVHNMFRNHPGFAGRQVAVVGMGHRGGFGVNVDVLGRVDLGGMNTQNLTFHLYNPDTNRAVLMENPSYSVLGNGFIRVTTNAGGYIIISGN